MKAHGHVTTSDIYDTIPHQMTTIISWNVNGIRAILNKGFVNWLQTESPDMLCIQETKAHPSQLTEELLAPAGYQSFWQSAQKKGYSGVCIYTKKTPLEIETLGIDEFDNEGRMQALYYDDFVLINCYYPNSQAERNRLPYKLRFNQAILNYCNRQVTNGKNIVLCGDYNVAHQPIDLEHPKSNENNAGYYIEEREMMAKFLDSGYVDTFRHFCKEPKQYTWWSYRMGARAKNVGWRIDYFCVNQALLPKVKESTIMADVYGSDHCPVKLVVG